MTSKEYSIVSMEAVEIYCQNHDRDTEEYIKKLDSRSYYMMNIMDYLVGNTDRHWGNWGMLVDNSTNRPVCLHKLMDFNRAFCSYDSPEGANCQTLFYRKATQREAAVEAVKKTGLNQKETVEKEIFAELPQYYDMFRKRMEILTFLSW